MRRVTPRNDWPESWSYSYRYDLLEIYGDNRDPSYSYAYAIRRRETLDMVNRVGLPGTRVLDVAAAQGNFTLTLAELGYEVTWNDLRGELKGYVEEKYEDGKVHYASGNVFDLECDQPFDVVLLTEIIEHVAHPDEFLTKISRLVKPGGYIVLTTPNGSYLRNRLPKFSDCIDPAQFEAVQFKPDADGHIFLLHADEIEPLAGKAGLCVILKRPHTNLLTHGYLKTRALLKVIPRALVFQIEHFTACLPESWQWKVSTGMSVLLSKPA